jgi:hypothetical protein
VFVSGGGVHIQASDSFVFQNGSITDCSVLDAFSTFLQSGGGALSTQNVSAVQISDSIFRDNSDSSSSGSIVLQQLKDDSGMNVTMHRSLVLIEPLNTPALNISCGSNCSQSQQQRINIRFKIFNTSAYSGTFTKQYDSSAILSLPMFSVVRSDRISSLNCLFNFTHNGAILFTNTGAVFSMFSCAPCERSFEIAQTSRTLELSNVQNVKNLGHRLCQPTASSDLQQCPFGVPFCSTTVNVSVGFWASFSADGKLASATRCPPNYCGCRNIQHYSGPSCQLFPPFAAEYLPDDALCSGNRTGVLCGGCKPGFTQSLNGYSCISNEVCQRNLGWVWLATVVGYTLYSLYIVTNSLQTKCDGLIMCVLFYGQTSAFASFLPIFKAQSHSSAESTWFSKITQFESVVSFYESTCYGPSMGAYEATLAQLSGPAIVVVVSLLLMFVAARLQLRFTNFFRKQKLKFQESFGVTFINVLQLLFSSVTSVVFRLITCVDLRHFVDDEPKRVFIDGTQKCSGDQYNLLVAAATLLSILLVSFFAGLKFDKISGHTRAVLCAAYTDTRHFWIAVQLFFRFVLTVISATAVENPSFAAMAMCSCTLFMLVMLVAFRPYVDKRTHYMDVFCHTFLVVQFLLQIVARVSEANGFSVTEDSSFYSSLKTASEASFVMRCVP